LFNGQLYQKTPFRALNKILEGVFILHCPKIDAMCAFCGKSKWNPRLQEKDDEDKLFCGLATGYDTRVEPLPKCWEQMTKHEKSKYAKMKKTEYETLILK